MSDNGQNRTPRALDCTNIAIEWRKWKQNFMVWMIANGKMDKPEKDQIATFIWLLGEQGMTIYNTLYPNDGSQKSMLGSEIPAPTTGNPNAVRHRTLEEVFKKFDEYCLPKKNVAMESYKFNMISQKEKQSFNEFETELRKQIQFCEFKCACGVTYEERMLRDRIIIGIHDKKLQLKLLDSREESLTKVIDTCKVFEAAHANKNILDSKSPVIATVATEEKTHGTIDQIKRFCFNCGYPWDFQHKNVCKAKEVTCRICSKKGHFDRLCRQKGKRQQTQQKKDDKDNGRNNRTIGSMAWGDMAGKLANRFDKVGNTLSNKINFRINSFGLNRNKWTKAYQIKDGIVKFKIDTGADVNCIPINLVKKMGIGINNQKNDYPVFDYSNNKVKIFGTVKLKCIDLKTKNERETFFLVVNDKFEPILGLDSCIDLGIVKRIDIDKIALPDKMESFVKQNGDIFNGFGKFPGEFKIYLRENSKPVLHYKKRIPHALTDRLKSELEKMVRDEIISPVDYPTDWVNNLQIVEKPNGRLRVCLDPKPLNACIKREHYLIPTIEDLTSGLAKASVFTVIDLTSGFWHMSLDKDTSDLTTFMTPFGRYKFNRLPFGLNCAPEMFQRTMVQIFGDIPGVCIYFDDILIFANDFESHDKILKLVVDRAREHNVKFNSEKIQYRRDSVKFMGNVISYNQVKPGRKYCEALLGMERPKDKPGVLRFLGLLKYLARFIPNLSKITAELRNLTRLDVDFKWTDKHETEFKNLLNVVASEPVLGVYDAKLPVTIQTDASKDGLGCVIVQNGHPIAFASRTLTKSEQRWAQIEKELLAIVFACQRFHYFLYGREFRVESDHKPLETLVKRDIDSVTMRLQRMFMFLLKYPQMTVVYKPGREMLVADCLSRAQLSERDELEGLSGVIHSVVESVCLSEENYNYYRKTLNEDENYARVCKYVENGWPSFHQLNDLSQHFHKLKSELHVERGLLFLDHRLVIPTKLQERLAIWLHEPHLGIEKTLARARKLYYWPGMNGQIKGIVQSCSVCEKFHRNNQKEPLVQEESPKYPFEMVAMDLFEYAGRDYIAIIDYYSNYLIAISLNNKTSGHIIEQINRVFFKMGFPTAIKCDNSPFGSREFDRYASEFNIKFKFSSPRYPQSNGLAEKGVAIAENILKRCYEANDVMSYQYRILEYNTTPVASMQLSPSELFFGRLIKTKLPVSDSLLVRNNLKEELIQEKIEKKG